MYIYIYIYTHTHTHTHICIFSENAERGRICLHIGSQYTTLPRTRAPLRCQYLYFCTALVLPTTSIQILTPAVHNTPSNSRTAKLLGRHWEILDANGIFL